MFIFGNRKSNFEIAPTHTHTSKNQNFSVSALAAAVELGQKHKTNNNEKSVFRNIQK